MDVERLLYWITERQQIYQLKMSGHPKPWTIDPILKTYRFCNVYREQDTVTKWIADNWRRPHADDPDLWYSMVVARLANLPSTLAVLGYAPSPQRFMEVLTELAARGEKVFNSAYIVSTNGRAMPKPEYLMKEVLEPLWAARAEIRPKRGETLATGAARLVKHNGMGTFMTGQVIADTKYVGVLASAPDWSTWAFSGPGSRRGLNIVFEKPTEAPWKEQAWHEALLRVRDTVNFSLPQHMEKLHAQDMQNCLCEYSKYMKALTGVGRPKCHYPGAA